MDQHFTAPETRRELLIRLEGALTSDGELQELVEFLRDDLAFDPDNQSIVGCVLGGEEFACWRDLMTGVHWDTPWPIDYDPDKVRALSRKLLTEMRAT